MGHDISRAENHSMVGFSFAHRQLTLVEYIEEDRAMPDFNLSEEQTAIQQLAREFAVREIEIRTVPCLNPCLVAR
jgi:hypothetical protein